MFTLHNRITLRQFLSDDIPPNRLIFQWSSRTPSDLDLDGEELEATHGVVVADDDEGASLVRVENDRSVDRHLEIVLELSTENRIVYT